MKRWIGLAAVVAQRVSSRLRSSRPFLESSRPTATECTRFCDTTQFGPSTSRNSCLRAKCRSRGTRPQ